MEAFTPLTARFWASVRCSRAAQGVSSPLFFGFQSASGLRPLFAAPPRPPFAAYALG